MCEHCSRLVGLPECFGIEAPPVRYPRGCNCALRVDSMRSSALSLLRVRISRRGPIGCVKGYALEDGWHIAIYMRGALPDFEVMED